MSFSPLAKDSDLKRPARDMFDAALLAVDAESAVRAAVRIENERLFVLEKSFDLRRVSKIYSIAVGKAAVGMASALSEILKESLSGAVVSAPTSSIVLPAVWQKFVGGHPVPNVASLEAAQAAYRLLAAAAKEDALVIFLISGGGSAMMELPRDSRLTLSDLQTTNRVLTNCGATIAEINFLRRKLSAIKGGGLGRIADRAQKLTLIISDTNDAEVHNVASGLTVTPENDFSAEEMRQIIEKYRLYESLPRIVGEALKDRLREEETPPSAIKNHSFAVLLSNKDALRAAAKFAEKNGFIAEIVPDLIEAPVEAGCAELVKRLIALREWVSPEKPVALVSGGEFICPVRGGGIGGRNSEAVLRAILEIEKLAPKNFRFAVLQAGTDGIDGNSTAAGAIADDTTLTKARALNLNAREHLANSDAYNFFRALNGAIVTGATGTNVRDVRLFLA